MVRIPLTALAIITIVGMAGSRVSARHGRTRPHGAVSARGAAARVRASAGPSPGARLFAANCGRCHGAQGRGGFGPDLRRLVLPEAQVRETVRDGRGDMPAFGSHLNDTQMGQVVSYVLSLRTSRKS